MKDRQTIESRLREYRREESKLSSRGHDTSLLLEKIATLLWVLE